MTKEKRQTLKDGKRIAELELENADLRAQLAYLKGVSLSTGIPAVAV